VSGRFVLYNVRRTTARDLIEETTATTTTTTAVMMREG